MGQVTKPLTPKQQAVYDAIVAYRRTHPYSPTLEELSAILGLARSTVSTHCNSMVDSGWLIKKNSTSARNLVPVGLPTMVHVDAAKQIIENAVGGNMISREAGDKIIAAMEEVSMEIES